MSESAVRVVVDPGEAKRGVSQAEQALRRLSNTIGDVDSRLRGLDKGIGGVGKAASTADRAFVRTGASARQMASGLGAANDNAIKANGSLLRMAASAARATIAVAGLSLLAGGITGLAVAFTNASDAMASMEAKVRIAVGSQGNLAGAMKEVRDIADSTRSGLTEIGALYAKMATNTKNLGLAQSAVGVATKTFAQILKVSGANANESASAILQLGQAMGSGVLQGDEFKAINEATNGQFVELLAKSLGKAREEMKKLGSEGKLTGKVVAEALTNPKLIADIEAKFGMLPVTFADYRTAFGNAGKGWAAALMAGFSVGDSMAVTLAKFQQWARDMEPVLTNFAAKMKEAFGVVAPIFSAIGAVVGPVLSALFNNLELVARAAMVAGSAFLAFKAATMVGTLTATVGQIIALEKAMGATSAMSAIFSASMKMAQGAVNGLTASLMLNPYVALTVAIVAAGVALYQFSDQIGFSADGLGTLADAGNVVWGDIKAGLYSVGQTMAQTWEDTKKWASGAWDEVSSMWGPIGDWIADVLSPVSDHFKSLFGDLEFSFYGYYKFVAKTIDAIINMFVNAGIIIGNVWRNIPAIIGAAVTGAANFVISGIENMINRAINGINMLISMANNIPMVNLDKFSKVSVGRVDGPAMPSMGDITAGTGKRKYVEGYVDSVKERADARAAGRTGKPKPGASAAAADNGATAPSAADGKGAGDKKGDSAKDKLAEANKKYDEFIQKMKDELVMAGKLKHEAELYNLQLEAKKILGERYVEDVQGKEIAGLLEQKRLAEALTGMRQEEFELQNESKLLEESLTTLMADQQEYADRLLKHRLDYINKGGDLAKLTSDEWVALEQTLILEWKKNDALKERLALRKEEYELGKKLFKEAGVPLDGTKARAEYDRDRSLSALATVIKPDNMSDADFEQRMKEANKRVASDFDRAMGDVAKRFNDEMVGAINQIGDALGGKIGSLVNMIGNAIDAMGKAQQGDYSSSGLLGGIARLGSLLSDKFELGIKNGTKGFSPEGIKAAFKDPLGSMSSSFGSLKDAFNPAKGGSIIKGIGSAVGGAMQGAAMGTAIAGVGKMIWSKFSKTGSQVGGAIGSIGGPVGSAIGSLIGGTIGGLLKKSKTGSQGFKFDAAGNLVAGNLTGNSKTMKGAAAGAGNSVISSINNIAQALGADLTGVNMASIGLKDGKYRVDFDGSGDVKVKKGAKDFGKDGEAAAVAAVIADALKKGVLTGISDFSQRVVRGASASNLDAQVALAARYETILRDLVSLEDPITGPLKTLTKEFDKLRATMVASGATTAELANIDKYYQLQRKQLLEDSVSDLKAFEEKLRGPGSGVTGVNRLNRMLTELSSFEAQIAAGKQVDQSKFTDLGSSIFDLAADLYGTATSEFQSIRSRLQAANGGAMQNVTDAIEGQQQVVTAITDNSAYLVAGNELMSTNNGILSEIRDLIAANQGNGRGFAGGFNYGGLNYNNQIER